MTAGEPTIVERRKARLIVVLGCLVLAALAVSSVLEKNATFDEGSHIPAGFSYVAFGDFRLNREHPPAVKLLAGLPLVLLRARADITDSSWSSANQWAFGSQFLYQWNDPDRMVFWARVPVIGLSILLAILVFHWSFRLYGLSAGVFALALYVMNPDLLAHGQLVTTDLGVTLGLFATAFLARLAATELSLARLGWLALAVSFAVVTKFTGILALAVVALVAGEQVSSSLPWSVTLRVGAVSPLRFTSIGAKLAVLITLLCVVSASAYAAIWAMYGFRFSMTPGGEQGLVEWSKYWSGGGLAVQGLQLAWNWRLLPEAYVAGLLHALEHENRWAYLLGRHSHTGWWYYFIVTFFVKTPIPLLVAIVLGVLWLKRLSGHRREEVVLLAPVAVYWALTLHSQLNIGHRHLLPIYPFLIVFASKIGRVLDASPRKPARLLAASLLIWQGVETARIYPHWLAYFNQFAGGPANGYRILVDSNLDWGQDLKGLAAYRRSHTDEPFFLSYFGTAPPEYYGIRAQCLPGFDLPQILGQPRACARFDELPSGALVAVSATNLAAVPFQRFYYRGAEDGLRRLRSLRPVANIGYSILIYRIP